MLGEATGNLNFDQIDGLISGLEKLEPQDIDALLATLSERGINIVGD